MRFYKQSAQNDALPVPAVHFISETTNLVSTKSGQPNGSACQNKSRGLTFKQKHKIPNLRQHFRNKFYILRQKISRHSPSNEDDDDYYYYTGVNTTQTFTLAECASIAV